MEARSPSAATASPRTWQVFQASHVQVGKEIAYTGGKTKEPGARDWLRVSRIDADGIHGYRVHPQDWEREVEFVVVNRQIEDHGVIVRG